jgi:hypothetical protein
MANCFIPNSTPATGRTSTTSSRRSRRLNSTTPLGEAISLTAVTELSIRKVFNAQRSTPMNREQAFNAQRSIQTVGRWTLDACSRFIGVGRLTFSFYGRVKGAWWPSRSSKPSSPSKRRGRFDSYPLRSFPGVSVAVSLCETRTSPTGRRLQRSLVKGGESDVT